MAKKLTLLGLTLCTIGTMDACTQKMPTTNSNPSPTSAPNITTPPTTNPTAAECNGNINLDGGINDLSNKCQEVKKYDSRPTPTGGGSPVKNYGNIALQCERACKKVTKEESDGILAAYKAVFPVTIGNPTNPGNGNGTQILTLIRVIPILVVIIPILVAIT